MTESAATSTPPEEAEELLESVERSREAAARRAGANWFAPVVVGVLLWVSSFLFPVWDGAAVAVFWLAVSPFAYYAVKRYEGIQLSMSGAIGRGPTYQLLNGWFIAACVVSGAIGGAIGEPDVINYGPLLGVVAAFVVSAVRRRTRRDTAWAAGVVAFLLVLVLVLDADEPAWIFAVAFGANLVLEGLTERNRRGA